MRALNRFLDHTWLSKYEALKRNFESTIVSISLEWIRVEYGFSRCRSGRRVLKLDFCPILVSSSKCDGTMVDSRRYESAHGRLVTSFLLGSRYFE